MSRLLLLSTYELGCQPLGIAGPAAGLRAEGHDIRVADLSVEDWPTTDVQWAEGLVCSVPMHTALRLGLEAVERARAEHPGIPVALHGLYAPVAARLNLLDEKDCAASGDPIAELASWAAELGGSSRPGSLKQANSVLVPDRRGLPGLEGYARFVDSTGEHLVGGVETTIGCNHRCRHCPVPVVFNGRSSAIDAAVVHTDIDQVVEMGAEHIHFGDPDFLNRPHHAMRIVNELHRRHPQLSFDATIKVSHLLRHRALLPGLAEGGLAFVISAFESTSDLVLDRLDKGHTAADLGTAIDLLRAVGVEVRPSLLPFTPWTRREDLVELFDFVAADDLVQSVDPVQLSIRLLLPPGSLLLELDDPELDGCGSLGDEVALGVAWTCADPLLDELQLTLAARCEEATTCDEATAATYEALRAITFEAFGRDPHPWPAPVGLQGPTGQRPRLNEPWFCCAEPTQGLRESVVTVGSVRRR